MKQMPQKRPVVNVITDTGQQQLKLEEVSKKIKKLDQMLQKVQLRIAQREKELERNVSGLSEKDRKTLESGLAAYQLGDKGSKA